MTTIKETIETVKDAAGGIGSIEIVIETPDGTLLDPQSASWDNELEVVVLTTTRR